MCYKSTSQYCGKTEGKILELSQKNMPLTLSIHQNLLFLNKKECIYKEDFPSKVF